MENFPTARVEFHNDLKSCTDGAAGIPNLRLKGSPDNLWLATHTSTSRDRDVAEGFAKDDGLLAEFRFEDRRPGDAADVSWM